MQLTKQNPAVRGGSINDYKKIHIEPKYRRLRPRNLVPVHKETLSWLGSSWKR